MFEYEIHQMRSADLIREAAHRRLVRDARVARKAARRAERRNPRHDTEGQVSGSGPRRSSLTRAA